MALLGLSPWKFCRVGHVHNPIDHQEIVAVETHDLPLIFIWVIKNFIQFQQEFSSIS